MFDIYLGDLFMIKPILTKGEPTVYPNKAYNKTTITSDEVMPGTLTAGNINANYKFRDKENFEIKTNTQVATQVNILNNKTKQLYETLDILESKLNPILLYPIPTKDDIEDEKGNHHGLVPLAVSLYVCSEDLEIIVNKLNELIARIEV